MEFATGALGTLLPKLGQLLQGEYQLQKNVRKNIEFLMKELEMTQATLRVVGEVPTEQLNELVKIWARDARELSYDMEDVVDSFLVRVQGPDPPSKRSSKRFIHKMKNLLTVGKRHEIGEEINDIKERAVELAARRDRYKVDTINHVTSSVDPRIKALYVKTNELVGTDEARKEIISKLTEGDEKSRQLQRIVSIVGFGGLGKTTLAKAVYDEIKVQFDCSAFVTVSRNPDMNKFLKDMLYKLDNQKYKNIHNTSRDVTQLIDLVREFISNRRYFVVIDDIWDIPNWENTIKLALPDDNTGCRIITTTRNLTVAKHIGGAYEMKPVSLDSSRQLLYGRIFGNNEGPEKFLEEDMAKISDKILKKCAGVPLAIITIASLLSSKGRNQMEFYDEVQKSIGTGMENNLDANNMRKILSYSYYDLPSHLKNCLLYLSMFPEDFEVKKKRLIWLWRAEGFIQHKEQGKSQFEIGKSYFNELINRSLIQPIENEYGIVHACRVHDMVLDLLCSLSSEENFISIFSGGNHTSAPATTRRLSIQVQGTTLYFPKLRSVVSFASVSDTPSFNVLRVLVLQNCKLGQGYDLKYLRNLFHLRYLELSDTEIKELPEEIVNLQFLETLNIHKTNISYLPSAIVQLRKLMFISITENTSVPNGIGNLRSLEHLSWLQIHDESVDHIEGLGLLTELRVLHIYLVTNKLNDKLVESLAKLQKLEVLKIIVIVGHQRTIGGLDDWVAPQRVRLLQTEGICWFSRLPVWMNKPGYFLDLYQLEIAVKEMQQTDLDILGRLPNLRQLYLLVDHEDLEVHGKIVIGADLFPCLDRCSLYGFVGPLVFCQGAMPGLTVLQFDFHVWAVRDIASSGGGSDLGLGNLPSLQYVETYFGGSSSKEDFVEAGAALRQALERHPNRPRFEACIKIDEWWRRF